MHKDFSIYVLDTETTGLNPDVHEIIELSATRINDDSIKTLKIRPENWDSIELDALRVNGHNYNELKNYMPREKAIVEFEDWMMEDGFSPDEKILVGQNPTFDLRFLENLWKKCNAYNSFPFGKRPLLIDTRQLALIIDLCTGEKTEFYNLSTLLKKYGLKNAKAHTAEADAIATKELFIKQIEFLYGKNNNSSK